MLIIDDSATPPALDGGIVFLSTFVVVVSGNLHVAATPL